MSNKPISPMGPKNFNRAIEPNRPAQTFVSPEQGIYPQSQHNAYEPAQGQYYPLGNTQQTYAQPSSLHPPQYVGAQYPGYGQFVPSTPDYGQYSSTHYGYTVQTQIQSNAPHGAPAAATLGAYNSALEGIRREINQKMNPMQRHLGRTLTVVSSAAALGGAITTGVLGVSALGAAATGVGLPVAAAAAIAGAGVFIGGTALAVMAGSIARSLVRKSLHKDPELQAKLGAVRELRDNLKSLGKLNEDQKTLLKNINQVLSKVDGFGAHFKSQLKLSTKTNGIIVGSAFAAVITVAALAYPPMWMQGGLASGGSLRPSKISRPFKGSPLRGWNNTPIDVPGGEKFLHAMSVNRIIQA